MSTGVAVSSVITHSAAVVAEFLSSLDRLGAQGPTGLFLLADDSNDPTSAQLMAEFAATHHNAVVVEGGTSVASSGATGARPDNVLWRRAAIKDRLLAEALDRGAGHVLAVDSNLLLPPPVLGHLVSLKLDVVAEVFWSEVQGWPSALPNVWLSDEHSLFGPELARSATEDQLAAADAFLTRLRQPGTYPVGGLSGCTLISHAALAAGASFKAISNLSFSDEDRHFSLRAAALGLSLWADTHFPPLRLHRGTDLGTALHFRSRWAGDDERSSEVTENTYAGGATPSTRQKRDERAQRTERAAAKRCTPRAPSKGTKKVARKAIVAAKANPASRDVTAVAGKVLFSACMIVKDEEKFLPDCLTSLRGLVDEIVVYDTGSTDATIEIARRSGATVIEGYWDDDFARARNASLAHCRGQWILWIDADERFSCSNMGELRSVLDQVNPLTGRMNALSGSDALAIDIYNLGDDPSNNDVNVHRALRIFRRDRCYWYGSLHEQVDLLAGLDGRLMVTPLKGAHIDHIGYRSDVVADRDKLVRNLRLAEAALAKDTNHRGQEGVAEMNVGRALAALNRFAEAQPHFDAALAEVGPGVAMRASLLFSSQNLVSLGEFEKAAQQAHRLGELCTQKGLPSYLEGMALRRLGRHAEAVLLFEGAGELSTEDGFVYPDNLLKAELAGTYFELGRHGEAADVLVQLVEGSPEVPMIRIAFQVFAAAGRSVEELAAAMPEDRLDKVAAALILVPPVIADPVAEALYGRFGPRPQLLAAAILFAPMLSTSRALDWSARLRAIGMTEPCPLVAQARIDVLEIGERVRAAVTAHAAFGDQRGATLARALVAGVPETKLFSVLSEVSALDAPLMADLAVAAAGPGATGAGPVGTPEGRRQAVAEAVLVLGHSELSTQIRNQTPPAGDDNDLDAQLAALGADR